MSHQAKHIAVDTDLALMVNRRKTKNDQKAIALLKDFNGHVAIIAQGDGNQQVLPSLRVEHVYFRGLDQIRYYVATAKKSEKPARAF